MLAALLASAAAGGQPAGSGAGLLKEGVQPRPVEQGVGDVNPLQLSNRVLPVDLRRPTGWERVYRLSGDPRKDGGKGLFARFDGGIAAVFPWSTYVPTEDGVKRPVPAGTTYYIGTLPDGLRGVEAGPAPERSFNFMDRSAHPGRPARPVLHAETAQETSAREGLRRGEPPAAAERPGPSIWTSEPHRRARLEALLTAAAAAK